MWENVKSAFTNGLQYPIYRIEVSHFFIAWELLAQLARIVTLRGFCRVRNVNYSSCSHHYVPSCVIVRAKRKGEVLYLIINVTKTFSGSRSPQSVYIPHFSRSFINILFQNCYFKSNYVSCMYLIVNN